ncbi:MAG: hypothetical protein IJ654_07995 [Bacteroidales bacterium]|nr:hypothetical protein [Bacteroidales bacterium]
MKKSFVVAGHRFSVEMPEGCPLWNMMGQYDPFEVPISEEDGVFSLTLVQDLPAREKEPVYTEAPHEEGQSRIELYRVGEGWRFEMAPLAKAPVCCVMESLADFSRAVFCIVPERRNALFALNNALMILYAFRTSGMDTLEMHSSVVLKDGKGYMFLGKSGTGKSTHSRQWLETFPGTELLNDDNPVIRLDPDGSARVYGTPWSGKTPCYRNLDAPVGAIVRIRQAPENHATRLSVVEAYASVYSSCSGLKSDRKIADGLHATLEKVVLDVPCFVLDCRPDHEAAEVCHEAVR